MDKNDANDKKPRLRIYNSFEEAATGEAQAVAMQAPIEHIRETVELILWVYGVTRKQLIDRPKSRRIKIIDTSWYKESKLS